MEPTPPSRLRVLLAVPLLLLVEACHGGHGSAPAPSFSLAVSPAALSIPAGGGGYATVTVTRSGGFDDAVTLTLDGAPAGVQGSGTLVASAQTAQLTLLVGREVAPQTLDALRVKGSCGSLTQSCTFKLVIAAALPTGRLSPDQVQASGGLQRAGFMENTGVVGEPAHATSSKDASGNLDVRHGFRPSGN